jgi:UDP-N-acetyl-D-mannosaminuronic acid transferase (WecB/TagA/CpsF family)
MRKRPAKALVEHVDAPLTWNAALSIGSAARETTERVGYPGTAPEVQSSVEERARAQVRSASELACHHRPQRGPFPPGSSVPRGPPLEEEGAG